MQDISGFDQSSTWLCHALPAAVVRRRAPEVRYGKTLKRQRNSLKIHRLDQWGKRAEAQEMLHELAELSKRGYLPAGAMAEFYAGLRDKDLAFQWLAKAVEERDVDIVLLKVDPLFDPIRPDPRFADLLRRVNLAP